MAGGIYDLQRMILFPCHNCQTPLCAEDDQAGLLVRCPTCSTAMRVPADGQTPPADAEAEPAAPGPTPPPPPPLFFGGPVASGRRYGFNCKYCSSRLEATESMAAQEGQCPTCGNPIVIPILDRYGRLIDPITREIIKLPPHPVHAYAAAGERAPRIERLPDGRQIIKCPRCASGSAITSNNCKSCGMPFTMEGTMVDAAGATNGFCVASLVLGIIGVPGGCTLVLPALAVIFAIVGMSQTSREGGGGGKGMAIAGLVCGIVGLIVGLMFYSH